MLRKTRTYYYLYRHRKSPIHIDWESPTGGLVVEGRLLPHQVLDIAKQRYHCAPWEQILCVEVLRQEERWEAALLHQAWEMEMRQWLELSETQ
jgi:hypothetical protein